MIANLLIFVFIILAALWFSNQGLFSSLLHLVLTLCAGAIGIALWEPLTLNYLINRIPEYAWGVGLIVPFAVALLLLRTAADWLVPGNVKFHNLVDSIGGGAVGVVNAMLAGGLLIVGLLFVSQFAIGGYQPYAIGVDGKVERVQSLWIPVDQFAASVFTGLSAGSLQPLGGQTMPVYQPNLAEAAGRYRLASRDGARSSIRPANVEVTRYFELQANQLPADVRPIGDNRVVVLRTNVQLTAGEDAAGAADPDGTFTATRPQVALIAVDAADETDAQVIYATGYVVGNDYGPLTDPQEFARSRAAVNEQAFDWVFHVPADDEPKFLQLKQTRFTIPEQPTMTASDVDNWLADTNWTPAPPSAGDNDATNGSTPDVGQSSGPGAEVEGLKIEVTDLLPHRLSRNWIVSSAPGATFDNEQDAIIRANGTVRLEGEIGRNLAINRIAHPSNAAIVRLQLTPAKAKSLYGRAMEFAAQVAPPLLVSDDGAKYSAIGWVRSTKAVVELHIDASSTIRSMSEIDVAELDEGEELYLYFRTGKGVRITSFEIGRTSQDVNLTVPR